MKESFSLVSARPAGVVQLKWSGVYLVLKLCARSNKGPGNKKHPMEPVKLCQSTDFHPDNTLS